MPNNEIYSLNTQSPPHKKVIEEILKVGGSIKQSELSKLTGQFLGLLKATILVLNSKGIIKSEDLTDGDKLLIIDPNTSTLDKKTLLDYNLFDTSNTLTKIKDKKYIQEQVTQPSSNNEIDTISTINITPRQKKIDTVLANSLLPMLKAVVNGNFFTSTVAEQLNLKPEVIQDALIELSNDGYFIFDEQDFGEGFFELTPKFNEFKVDIKEEPTKDIDSCINDIHYYLTKNKGSVSFSQINKDLLESYPASVIKDALNILSVNKSIVQKKIGRGLTIEYPCFSKNIENDTHVQDDKKQKEIDSIDIDKIVNIKNDHIKELAETSEMLSPTLSIQCQEKKQIEHIDIQKIIDLSKQQTSDLSTLIAKYMIQNIELEKRLQIANELLKQHDINITI